MFEYLANKHCIIVTGPHRSGTTICAKMIARDTGKPCILEESFQSRNIIKAESLINLGGIIQGPYLLPWVLLWPEAHIIYMDRLRDDVRRSVDNLKVSKPFFNKGQADALWKAMGEPGETIDYESLKDHKMWRDDRRGWEHRQTC